MDGLVTDADRGLIAHRAKQSAVLASLRHLATFPFVAERLRAGALSLHGWYFHFGWGVLLAAAGPQGPFRQIDPGRGIAAAMGKIVDNSGLPSGPDAV